jgi:hypothetical protein
MNRADGWDGRKMSFHTASRCSQQPMALPVSAVVGLLFVPVAFLAQPPIGCG